jgi:putative SOS response-associated peptidase YedK
VCNRYTQKQELHKLKDRFRFRTALEELRPRFNLAPSQPAPVIVANGERLLDLYRWGLIPSWAKDPKVGYKMMNARAETVAELPAYRRPFQRQRCLVPADGFFEWKPDPINPENAPKTPMYITLASEEPFAFGGLWDVWKDAQAREISSFTIITTEPNDLIQPIHNRMPAILKRKDEDVWLDPAARPEHLRGLLAPYPSDEMTAYPVSRLVNSVRNDSAELLIPAKVGDMDRLF